MAADCQAPWATWSSTAMILAMQDTLVFINSRDSDACGPAGHQLITKRKRHVLGIWYDNCHNQQKSSLYLSVINVPVRNDHCCIVHVPLFCVQAKFYAPMIYPMYNSEPYWLFTMIYTCTSVPFNYIRQALNLKPTRYIMETDLVSYVNSCMSAQLNYKA